MTSEGPEGQQTSFIVRVARDPAGRVSGVVERVRTREKTRFGAIEEVGLILAGWLAREGEDSRPGHRDQEGRS